MSEWRKGRGLIIREGGKTSIKKELGRRDK